MKRLSKKYFLSSLNINKKRIILRRKHFSRVFLFFYFLLQKIIARKFVGLNYVTYVYLPLQKKCEK